jgi:DNA-binding NarL/FixJ family response regulator
MESYQLRLLLIAEDPLARAGLAALLADQPGCVVVGQFAGEDNNLSAALELYQPDLILCDLGWNPGGLLERLLDLSDLGLPLVLLLPNESFVIEAWAIRPHALLPRDVAVEKLLAAIAAAGQGLVTLDPTFVDSLLLPVIPANPPNLAEALTPRELEVLQHLAEGLPNKAIARRLEISEHTVKFHVNAIMSKLGVQSRTEAVVRAYAVGLIML